MGRNSHQVHQSDVTAWGVAAIVCGGLAVLSVNVAGLAPDSALSRLHGTRLASGNLTELHTLLEEARATSRQVRRENESLLARFNLMDETSSEMVRRVSAVEQSMPLLIESLPYDSDIDRSLLTASVGDDAPEMIAVDGGQMTIERTPMFAQATPVPGAQPLPPPVESSIQTVASTNATPAAQGSAAMLGRAVTAETADAEWERLLDTAGPLLLGLEPRLVPGADGESMRLVAGPMRSDSAARALCDHIAKIGVACAVREFAGTPLED